MGHRGFDASLDSGPPSSSGFLAASRTRVRGRSRNNSWERRHSLQLGWFVHEVDPSGPVKLAPFTSFISGTNFTRKSLETSRFSQDDES